MSVTGIILLAPLLAKWALAFGPAEYFVLMVFAFCCLTSLLGKQPVKGVLAAMIGLGISVVGVDSNSGVYRYTFDSVHLSDGIDFVVVVIALFAVSEMLEMLEKVVAGHSIEVKPSGRKLFNLKELSFTWWSVVRSSLVGFGVGVLPGAGASVAAAVAYSQEKRIIESKDPDAKFGKGDMRGLVAPESAATASAIGSFVPMLTLGVPGSGTTAVMMGALTLYNITPGPVLFDSKPELVWGLIASLFIANVLLFIMNVPMVRVFSKVLAVPAWMMVPGILCISYIGVYAINAGTFDLLMVVAIGALGYFLRKFGVPMAPLVLGVVLGDMMEQNLRRALSITNGDPVVLYSSPVSIGLWIAAAAVVIVPQLMRRLSARRRQSRSVVVDRPIEKCRGSHRGIFLGASGVLARSDVGQTLDGGVQRSVLLGETKAHQMVVGFGRGGILVERRYRDHGYAMVDGEMAREIGFGVLGDLAVVGQHEECAGAGQGRKRVLARPAARRSRLAW